MGCEYLSKICIYYDMSIHNIVSLSVIYPSSYSLLYVLHVYHFLCDRCHGVLILVLNSGRGIDH